MKKNRLTREIKTTREMSQRFIEQGIMPKS